MKSNDVVILGALGVAAYFLFKSSFVSAADTGYPYQQETLPAAAAQTAERTLKRGAEQTLTPQTSSNIFDVASLGWSEGFKAKVRSLDLSKMPISALPSGLIDTGSKSGIPMSASEQSRNIRTAKSIGATEIRKGVYRKTENGITRVIYT